MTLRPSLPGPMRLSLTGYFDMTQQRGGRASQASGETSESLVEAIGRQYYQHGIMRLTKTYPQIVVVKKGKAVIVGPAQADYHATLTLHGGRACWIEVKTFTAVNKYTYPFITTSVKFQDNFAKRARQYGQLIEESRAGALAFYLVRWTPANHEESWALHPLDSITHVIDPIKGVNVNGLDEPLAGLTFYKSTGIQVPVIDGLPDFYESISQYIWQGLSKGESA